MKKTSLLLAVLSLILSACVTNIENNISTQSNYSLYEKTMKEFLIQYDNILAGWILLDGDDSNELIIMLENSDNYGAYLFTIKNDKVIQICNEYDDNFGQNGGFVYYEKQGCFMDEYETLTDWSISHNECYYEIDDYDGTALIKDIFCTTCLFDNHYTYYCNSKIVSYDEYSQVKKTYDKLENKKVVKYDNLCKIKNTDDIISFLNKAN